MDWGLCLSLLQIAKEMWGVCLIATLIIIAIFIVLIRVFSEKLEVCQLPKIDLPRYMRYWEGHMRKKGWKTKVDMRYGKLTVSKTFVEAHLYFDQVMDGTYILSYEPSATTITWVGIIIVSFIFYPLGGLLAIWSHVQSKKFAYDEIIPMVWGSVAQSIYELETPMEVEPEYVDKKKGARKRKRTGPNKKKTRV